MHPRIISCILGKLNSPPFVFCMYELTPPLLNLYQDCNRCFWVEIHENVRRPRETNGALPTGMELMFKQYTDRFRELGMLPSELAPQIEGKFLPDPELIKRWRDPKKGLFYSDEKLGVRLQGHPDECIVSEMEGKTFYRPLKFKTRGFDPKEESHDHHAQLQLDCYDLLMSANGFETGHNGYIVYYVPEQVQEKGLVQFHVQVIQLVTEGEGIKSLLDRVVKLLNAKMPPAGKDCEYCRWGDLGVEMMRRTS